MERKKRIVIYGLGFLYEKHKEQIESMPGIVAHCDRSAEKVRAFADGIMPEELTAHIDDYDIVYVTAAGLKVLPSLLDDLHIPLDKIVLMDYEHMNSGGAQPQVQFYGMNNEEAVLLYLLQLCGRSTGDITYLEIGTNDPVRNNNSYFFYEQGARGVLVDPLPAVGRMIELFRPEDRFVHTAVTDHAEHDTITFYESNMLATSSIHADFQEEFDDGADHTVKHSYTVPLIGVNELLATMDDTPDLLLIDAEGEDVTIAEGVDYEKYRPLIIMVEVDHGDEAGLIRFLAARGYTWFTTISHTNAVFVRTEAME